MSRASKYMLIGKTMFVGIRLLSTATGAGMGTQLIVKIPGGFTCPLGLGWAHFRMDALYETGLCTIQNAQMIFFRQTFNASFPTATVFDLRAAFSFEIA